MIHGAEALSDAAGERRGEARFGNNIPTPAAAETALTDSVDANAEVWPRGLEHGEASHAVGGDQKDELNEKSIESVASSTVPTSSSSETDMKLHSKEASSPTSNSTPTTNLSKTGVKSKEPFSLASSTLPTSHSSTADIESNVSASSVQYPEGGLEAWSVVFGSFCGMLAAFGLMNAVGVYQTYLSTNQLASYDESTISWIFGLYIFLAFFCGVQIGPVFDSKGPRYLVLAGSVLLLAAVFLVAESTQYWHFILSFGLLAGLGTSLIFTPAVSAIGHFFSTARGSATGIATTGGSLGGVIFPLMLQRLFPLVGFAWSTRILAFLLLILLILANALIKSRLPPKPGGSVWPDFLIFRDKVFTLTTAGVFFIEWGLFIPISYISLYALHVGLDPALSYQLIALLNVGSIFGRWLPGYVADRLGRFNTMILTIALSLLFTLAFWLPISTPSDPPHSTITITPLIIIFALGFGFSSGSNISLTPVCVGQLCETEELGRYYATCYTVVSFGCLTGIPIAGAILRYDGGEYWGLVLFTSACYAGGLACFVAGRVMRVGWVVTKIF
ncbi:hypothetical protein MMC30_004176 [Trapelia coarctata]|nr:hypothetical protein [Trapelia coarctata]